MTCLCLLIFLGSCLKRLTPFFQIENDEDVLWKADVREPNEDVAARGIKFINWCWVSLNLHISFFLEILLKGF